jgi:hypothetical protein
MLYGVPEVATYAGQQFHPVRSDPLIRPPDIGLIRLQVRSARR